MWLGNSDIVSIVFGSALSPMNRRIIQNRVTHACWSHIRNWAWDRHFLTGKNPHWFAFSYQCITLIIMGQKRLIDPLWYVHVGSFALEVKKAKPVEWKLLSVVKLVIVFFQRGGGRCRGFSVVFWVRVWGFFLWWGSAPSLYDNPNRIDRTYVSKLFISDNIEDIF